MPPGTHHEGGKTGPPPPPVGEGVPMITGGRLVVLTGLKREALGVDPVALSCRVIGGVANTVELKVGLLKLVKSPDWADLTTVWLGTRILTVVFLPSSVHRLVLLSLLPGEKVVSLGVNQH